MINELDYKDFHRVEALLEGINNFPEAKAVVLGSNPGKIYTENTKNPTSALLWCQGMQGYYLLGDEKNPEFLKEIGECIDSRLLKELKQMKINSFEISGVHQGWDIKIEELFKNRKLDFGYQWVHCLNESKHSKIKQARLPDIRRYNGELQPGLLNSDLIVERLQQFWGSIDSFLNEGICFYAVADMAIVAVCYTGFKVGNLQAIGIETISTYRNRGYAGGLAVEFIKACHNQGNTPYWDCSDSNTASIKLAEGLGFEKKDKYRCYWFEI